MSNTGWYAARYRSWLPWRRYVVVRWVHDASGDGSWLGPGRFEFLDRHGGEEYRGLLADGRGRAEYGRLRELARRFPRKGGAL